MNEIMSKVLSYTGLNVKQFSEKIGLKRAQAIYDVLNGKTQRISEKLAIKIISEFPEFRKSWLMTGEGEMLKNPAYSNTATPLINAEESATAFIGDNNKVNADQTIAMLVAEVAAQRRVTEKVLEQNSELLAMIAANNNKK